MAYNNLLPHSNTTAAVVLQMVPESICSAPADVLVVLHFPASTTSSNSDGKDSPTATEANSSKETGASVVSESATEQNSHNMHQATSTSLGKSTSAQPTLQQLAATSPSNQPFTHSTQLRAFPSTAGTQPHTPSTQLLAAAQHTLKELQYVVSMSGADQSCEEEEAPTVHVDDQQELELLEAYYSNSSSNCSCGKSDGALARVRLIGCATILLFEACRTHS
jgi:hypothetical protein